MSEDFRDRVVGLERLPARVLLDHTGNWRLHPQKQRDLVTALLRDIGIADVLLIYDSPVHGENTIIDGHLRKDIDPEQTWPCVRLDVSDEEAAVLLLTLDPLAELAEANAQAHTLLREQAAIQSEMLRGYLAEQAQRLQQAIAATVTPRESPGEFESYDEDLDTDYCCPKCGYAWSGKPR